MGIWDAGGVPFLDAWEVPLLNELVAPSHQGMGRVVPAECHCVLSLPPLWGRKWAQVTFPAYLEHKDYFVSGVEDSEVIQT